MTTLLGIRFLCVSEDLCRSSLQYEVHLIDIVSNWYLWFFRRRDRTFPFLQQIKAAEKLYVLPNSEFYAYFL